MADVLNEYAEKRNLVSNHSGMRPFIAISSN